MKQKKIISFFWNSDAPWFMTWNIPLNSFEALFSRISDYFSDLHLDGAQIVVLGNNERGHRNFTFSLVIENKERGKDNVFKRSSGASAMRPTYLNGAFFVKRKISL